MNTQQNPLTYAARSRILLALFGVPLLWLGSCRSNPPGQITIDKAEVFTRERLVNRRLQEQQWLEKKLDFDILDTTFQGSRDLREFRGIVAALRAEFDPLGSDLQEATLENQIQDRKRQQELAAIQHDTNLLRAEIDQLKAQQDLARLQENPDADVPGRATASGPSASSGLNNSTLPDASAITKPFDTLQKTPLPDPEKLHSGSAQLTSVEKLRDELAYRNAVHAALRETELDDAHDLNGYTLRTLKFDISVMPHDRRAEHIGMIRLTADTNANKFEEPNKEVYRAWQQSVLRQARMEALSLQRRYMQGLITDDDIVQSPATKARVKEFLFRLLVSQKTDLETLTNLRSTPPNVAGANGANKPITSIDRRKERISNLEKALAGLDALQFNQPSRADQEFDEDTSIALCKIAEWRYKALDGKYLYFNDIPTAVQIDGGKFYLPDLWPSPERIDRADRDSSSQVRDALTYREALSAALRDDGTQSDPQDKERLEQAAKDEEKKFEMAELSYEIHKDAERIRDFKKAIRKLDCMFKPYVYTVEPKELAQNISDVAAAEKLSSLVLAASAALPQSGVNASGYLNQLDRSQLRLHAILRRPLVVGFVDQKDENVSRFGWALGPRFEIGHERGVFHETGAALFGQTRSDVRYRQVEAQHSVQATIAIPGWLEKIAFKYEVGWRDPSRTWPHERMLSWGSEKRLVVNLARDYDAITNALLTLHQAYDQVPTVLPAKSSDPHTAPYLLTEGEQKASILIRGTNLWRNPKVFIGGQEANEVTVLPDMGGLHATFETVKLPTTLNRGSARVDLSIVTSQGIARLPQAVQILPKATVKPTGAVELKTAYAVPDEKVQFVASAGLIPRTSHFSAHLRARDIRRTAWFDVIAASVSRKTSGRATELEFKLDPSQKLIDQPARLKFDLAIQDEYGAPYRSIPSFAGIKGELVYFPDANQAKLRAPDEALKAKRETKQPPNGSQVTTYHADHDLVFQTDANVSLDLFKRAHSWIVEEKTAFRVEFTPVGDRTPVSVPFGPGELQLSGSKPGRIIIGKGDLIGRNSGEEKSKEKELFDLYDSIGDTSKQPKCFKVKIKHPNGKESVEVDGVLAITIEPGTR